MTRFKPVEWDGDAVRYLDQRLLPREVRYERARTADEIVDAIKSLGVRGAPCIGVFGAYGVALLRRTHRGRRRDLRRLHSGFARRAPLR